MCSCVHVLYVEQRTEFESADLIILKKLLVLIVGFPCGDRGIEQMTIIDLGSLSHNKSFKQSLWKRKNKSGVCSAHRYLWYLIQRPGHVTIV
jgi:hypothetical protein